MFRYLQFQSSRQNSLSGCCLKRYFHEAFSAVTQSCLPRYLLLSHLPAFAVSLSSLFLSQLLGKDLSYKRLATYTNLYKNFCLLAIFFYYQGRMCINPNRNILKSSTYKALVIPRAFMFLSAALGRVENQSNIE